MSFTLHLKKITERAGAQADNAVKRIAIDLFSSVTLKSPVDKGRFRGNWQLGIGAIDGNIDSPESKDGSLAIARAANELNGFKSGKTIYISNSLPYARTLEYGEYGTGAGATEKTTRDGYSVQAPYGMVRITIVEFKRKLGKALNRL